MRVLAVLAAAVLLCGAGAKPISCRDEAGHDVAATFVRDCMLNSPATHPPCNEANPCWMIVKEVVRACQFGEPADVCARYKDLQRHYPVQSSQG